jgi:hypothetical protein
MERNKIKRSYLEAQLTSPIFAVVVQVTSGSGVVHILLFAGRLHLFFSRSRLLTYNSNCKKHFSVIQFSLLHEKSGFATTFFNIKLGGILYF